MTLTSYPAVLSPLSRFFRFVSSFFRARHQRQKSLAGLQHANHHAYDNHADLHPGGNGDKTECKEKGAYPALDKVPVPSPIPFTSCNDEEEEADGLFSRTHCVSGKTVGAWSWTLFFITGEDDRSCCSCCSCCSCWSC